MTRILIVEDSPTQAEELRLILESEGFEVTTAPDGREALDQITSAPFDLVVSDILMPQMTGYEFCHAAKTDPRTRNLPLILLTTLSDPMDIIQGLECGADNFVTKPYEAPYLIDRVKSILENKRLRIEGRLKLGVEIFFLGRKFTITSDKEQILDLLISTFEDIVRKNRELEASQAALAAANRELEAFSYSVSHDLRAPLRSIDGFSHALVEEYSDRLDGAGLEYLQQVRDSAQRMGELIDDLLELSRVGRSELRRDEVQVSAVVRAIAANLERQSPDRTVDFIVRDGLVCEADPQLLRIALENLLGNAWKFTSKVSHSRIEFGARDEGGQRAFFVRDNGAGFDPAYAAKLFSPFQRLHAMTDFPGTGIGLAIVQRIVNRHGGRVWAEGAEGKGATFWFTL
ncbi:MAG: sensor histidine kinase [Candidatus Binatia bacterium]